MKHIYTLNITLFTTNNVSANIFILRDERQASIVLERYFRFEISLLSILCMLIARMEMGTSVSFGRFRYYYVNYRTFARR